MNLDHFLDFWSQHNQTIIQALIVVTLIFIVALVFITLFSSKSEQASGSQMGISPELEKSLQKMLENQTKAAVFDFSKSQENAPPSSIASAAAGSPEATAQVEKLKSEMIAKEKRIQELQAQLSEASAQATSAPADPGLDAKVKELEARLAEYDIISEDIADLSRYKEENEKIKAELVSLKSGGASPAPAAAQPAAVAAPDVKPVATEPPAPPMAAVEAAPVAEPAVTAMTEPEAQTVAAAAAPEVDPAISAAIDDDLMKEFAAAVEGQKAATAASAVAAPAPGADNEDLMGQFENFVQKKEGS